MYAFSTISLASCWLGEPVATLLSMVNKRGHKQSLVHVFVAVDIWNKLESWEALPWELEEFHLTKPLSSLSSNALSLPDSKISWLFKSRRRRATFIVNRPGIKIGHQHRPQLKTGQSVTTPQQRVKKPTMITSGRGIEKTLSNNEGPTRR